MLFYLFATFLIIPLIEIALFIAVGSRIGIAATLLLCVASAVTGAVIVRHQGLQTIARLQERLRLGELPTMELAEGAAILAAGILLITPGFFTDAIGFTLLFPPTRRWIINWLGRRYSGEVQMYYSRHRQDPFADRPRGPTIIDVEAEEVDDEPGNPASPWRHD